MDIWEKIGKLAVDNPNAMALFGTFQGRKRNIRGGSQSVQEVASAIGSNESEVRELFKEMQQIGVGRFVMGRKGHASRFEYAVSVVDIANAIESLSPDESDDWPESDTDLRTYDFPVRLGVMAKVIAPVNLSQIEAARFGKFVAALGVEA
jgi:hypothetical protein